MQITTEPAFEDRKHLECQPLSAHHQKLINDGTVKSSEQLSKEVATSLQSANAEAQLPQRAREKPQACMYKDVYFHIGG